MRERILQCLAGTRLPVDPVGEAEQRIPTGAREVWFRLPLRPAAVLIPLLHTDAGIELLLTERTSTLPDHPGQVAFPGGRAEAADDSLLHTALRETREEIGLEPHAVALAGFLRTQPVISGYAVVPVVGFIPHPFDPVPDQREVAEVFRVPLEHFMDDGNGRLLTRERGGVRTEVWEYWYDGHRVWGATASIVRDLVGLLKV